MRSTEEILKLVMDMAEQDPRVRAVIMNGSRVNPNAKRDIFQDFDIVFVVTDVLSFRNDREFPHRFGEIMVMQLPEEKIEPPAANDGGYIYLIQFADGNRIDLNLYPVSKIGEMHRDSLSRLLLDKDGIIEPFDAPHEGDYLPKPPSFELFDNCCDEFWWVACNVAKGLWRDEVLYAKGMFEIIRGCAMKMLVWHVGCHTDFAVNFGTFQKWLKGHVESELWEKLEQTYVDTSIEKNWDALFALCDLFRVTSKAVSQKYGFSYRLSDDENVTAHLKHVRMLPRDAREIYLSS